MQIAVSRLRCCGVAPAPALAPVAVIVPLMVVLWLGGARGVSAQETGRVDVPETGLDSVRRHIEFISPRSGPPGTTVTLRTGGLPALTPVRIGMGAIRFGFEELAQALTTERGELSLSVEVPAWGRRDVPHVFIVFDFYFAPIALSDVFDVTGPDGTVQREGRITGVNGECASLRGDDDVVYALAGDLSGFEAGDEVTVEGSIAEEAACREQNTIELVRIRPRR